MGFTTSPSKANSLSDEDLLELYLSLSKEQREKRFADTMRAAEITGLSIRTIQFWIENGLVRAVTIGRKYKVDLVSLKEFLKAQMSKKAS